MPHVHELNDFTSSGYIVFKQKILLVHHKKLKVWISPGGHIELDEDPITALWREILEETGLNKKNLELISTGPLVNDLKTTKAFHPLQSPFAMFITNYDNTTNHKHIDLCYLLKSNTFEVTLEESSSHDIGWFTLLQLDKLFINGHMFQNSYTYSKFAINYFKK